MLTRSRYTLVLFLLYCSPIKALTTPCGKKAIAQKLHVTTNRRTWMKQLLFMPGLFLVSTSPSLLLHPAEAGALEKVEEEQRQPLEASPPSSPLDNRPYAPVEALVPATQQQLLLQRALFLAKQWAQSVDRNNNIMIETELKSILQPPSSTALARRNAISMTRRYRNDQTIIQQQVDVSRQLTGIGIRAALNVYTANLRFGETYVLTASAADKKQLIRNYSQLPDVKQVITADLDLRDLYRNQIQTLIEDAQAELYNNIDNSSSNADGDNSTTDVQELVDLLQQANNAMDQWMGLISAKDKQDALRQVQLIQQQPEQRPLPLPQQRFSGYNFFS